VHADGRTQTHGQRQTGFIIWSMLYAIVMVQITIFTRAIFKILSLTLISKFTVKSSLNIPPHLKYVATLPCEMLVFKTSSYSRTE